MLEGGTNRGKPDPPLLSLAFLQKTEKQEVVESHQQCEQVGKMEGRPGVVAGDVVEEGLRLVVVAVGAKRVALVVGVALAVLGLHARVALVLAVHRLFRFFRHLLICWERAEC